MTDQLPEEELPKRALELCRSFICNLAFSQAYAEITTAITTKPDNIFWDCVEANFLAMAVLEWCKLFGGPKNNEHYWGKIIADNRAFLAQLQQTMSISEKQLTDMINPMKDYRDKFIGHLDRVLMPVIPDMKPYLDCIICLHDYLLDNECCGIRTGVRLELPMDGRKRYEANLAEGMANYQAAFTGLGLTNTEKTQAKWT